MRIQPLEPPFTDDVAPLLERMMPAGMPPIALFRTFAHNPAMTNGINGWGSYYLSKQSSLDLRTRELVIDRATARCGCEYEWGIHIALFAERVLLTPEQIRSITFGNSDDPCWTTPSDRLTIELVDDLHDHATIGADLWERLVAEFATAQLLDLMLLTGWYHAISYVARSVELDPEPFATRFNDIR
jgi:alkylhydroperoxidase family enzyme